MHRYHPISCDLHDYLEIACLHRLLLQVELLDGEVFRAIALTTLSTARKEEFLRLDCGGQRREVRLDALHAITPQGPAVPFGRIVLAQRPG